MPRPTGRLLTAVSSVAMLTCVCATVAYGADAGHSRASAAPKSSSSTGHARGRHSPRVGGRVHSAWPKTGRAPRTQLDRWLARQVGAIKPLACAKLRRQARRRCHLTGPKRHHAHVVKDAA